MQVKHQINIVLLIGLMLFSVLTNSTEIKKSPNDNRDYKALELDNGMRVILISDPDADLAAASLSVNVGSFHDYPDREGLAHFLEHMLFLGTKKYPNPEEYREYILKHGGHDNASTGDMRTRYFFSIVPQYLPGALDRFAQFFIAPNFDEDLVDRERHAVHSEYQMWVREDAWRLDRIEGLTGNENHPITKFSIGSLDTLGDEGHARSVREDLIEFYKTYYNAENMILVIVGPQSLKELEDLVHKNFNQVPNNSTAGVEIKDSAYTPAETGLQIEIQSLGNHQELHLVFPIPRQNVHYDKQSINYLMYMLSQSSSGGLKNTLKEKNWIMDMAAGYRTITHNQDAVRVVFELTDDGLANYSQVISYFFAYIDFLRDLSPQAGIFADLKSAGQRNFIYLEKSKPLNLVMYLPDMVRDYPIEYILTAGGFNSDTKFNEEHIISLIQRLEPSNMRVSLLHSTVEGNKKEEYFDVSYSVHKFSKEELISFTKNNAHVQFALPVAIDFMPKDFSLHQSDSTSTQSLPQLILQKPGVSMWIKEDSTFRQPKENILLLLSYPNAQSTARRALLQEFMLQTIQNGMHEIDDALALSGVKANISANQQGLVISLNLFSDREEMVLDKILDYVTTSQLTATRFQSYKDSINRDLENFSQELAFRQAIDVVKSTILEPYWLPSQMLDEMPSITQSDLSSYMREAFANMQVKALMHGNILRNKSISLMQKITQKLKIVSNKQIKTLPDIIRLKPGANFSYIFDPNHNDATVVSYYQAPNTGDHAIAENALLTEIIDQAVFEQLRTQEQLGYVVSVSNYRQQNQPGAFFVIQSPHKSPLHLNERFAQFLHGFGADLADMPLADFDRYRESLQHNLLKKPANLTEETMTYWTQILNGTNRFDFQKEIAKELDKVTLEQLISFYKSMWLETRSRRLVTIASKSSEGYTQGTSIESIPDFKAVEVYE